MEDDKKCEKNFTPNNLSNRPITDSKQTILMGRPMHRDQVSIHEICESE